jgi:hypothetical protein
MARSYWRDELVYRDWNLSWNDESYRAARWMAQNLPADAVVGSWNAGVLGYYSMQRVVNLDGLVNDYALLPYLEQRRIDAYILREGVRYLSDLDPTLEAQQVKRTLRLTEVYHHYSQFMLQYYKVYRVDGPAAAGDGPAALPRRTTPWSTAASRAAPPIGDVPRLPGHGLRLAPAVAAWPRAPGSRLYCRWRWPWPSSCRRPDSSRAVIGANPEPASWVVGRPGRPTVASAVRRGAT